MPSLCGLSTIEPYSWVDRQLWKGPHPATAPVLSSRLFGRRPRAVRFLALTGPRKVPVQFLQTFVVLLSTVKGGLRPFRHILNVQAQECQRLIP